MTITEKIIQIISPNGFSVSYTSEEIECLNEFKALVTDLQIALEEASKGEELEDILRDLKDKVELLKSLSNTDIE